jgi:hypothetical protein
MWSSGQSSWLQKVDILCFLWGKNWICYVNKVARLCAPVFRVPCYTTEMYCVSCEVRTEYICYVEESNRLCCLVVRVPGYTTEMYCVSCEVRTEYICYVEESRPALLSSGQSSWLHNGDVLFFLRGTKYGRYSLVGEAVQFGWDSVYKASKHIYNEFHSVN